MGRGPGILGVLVLGLVSAFILAWAGAGWSSLLLGVIGVGVWQASASTFQKRRHLPLPGFTIDRLGV